MVALPNIQLHWFLGIIFYNHIFNVRYIFWIDCLYLSTYCTKKIKKKLWTMWTPQKRSKLRWAVRVNSSCFFTTPAELSIFQSGISHFMVKGKFHGITTSRRRGRTTRTPHTDINWFVPYCPWKILKCYQLEKSF